MAKPKSQRKQVQATRPPWACHVTLTWSQSLIASTRCSDWLARITCLTAPPNLKLCGVRYKTVSQLNWCQYRRFEHISLPASPRPKLTMSLTRITDRRRYKRAEKKEEVLATRLDFLHSDGESSADDHDEVPYDNMASPFTCSRIPMEDPSSASDYLDIDLPTTSPDSSPRATPRRPTRRGRLSPISFDIDESEDQVDGDLPAVCQPSPAFNKFQSPCPIYPPHRKLRSLRLFDVPHTPKTLLEKCQRRKRPSRKFRTPRPQPENRPQANINPFTPDNNHPGSVSSLKRSRSAFERYVHYFEIDKGCSNIIQL